MPNSLKGHFLIAGYRLRDPNFFKSVVLIVEHGAEGAMGLVINAPSGISLREALKGCFEIPKCSAPVFTGGPVEPAALFILHNTASLDPCESPVVPDVYMAGSSEVFEKAIQSTVEGDANLKFRVFCGCSGWGPGQLEGELTRGDWIAVPACAAIVFKDDPYEIWDELMAATRASSPIAQGNCDHPEWN